MKGILHSFCFVGSEYAVMFYVYVGSMTMPMKSIKKQRLHWRR